MAVSNAPLATIDITALKPSRFLLEHAALPYRDHEGRINVHLCTESEKELSIPGVASSRADIPQGVQDTLKAWTRHARAWALKEGPTWTREEGAPGGAAVWVSSAGERLREGGPPAKAWPAREGTESSSSPRCVTSRVTPRCFIALHDQQRGGGVQISRDDLWLKEMALPAQRKTSFAAFKVATLNPIPIPNPIPSHPSG